jgi:hypothetical protein
LNCGFAAWWPPRIKRWTNRGGRSRLGSVCSAPAPSSKAPGKGKRPRCWLQFGRSRQSEVGTRAGQAGPTSFPARQRSRAVGGIRTNRCRRPPWAMSPPRFHSRSSRRPREGRQPQERTLRARMSYMVGSSEVPHKRHRIRSTCEPLWTNSSRARA